MSVQAGERAARSLRAHLIRADWPLAAAIVFN